MSVTRCAVIGLGMIGQEHVRILRSLPQVDLVAVCDLRSELREHYAAQGLTVTDSVEECLSTTDLDAVWICTPQSTHRAIAEAALGKGLNVMCEKPIADEHDDALALALIGDESESILAIGHTLRFQNEFLGLKRAVDSGVLGDIVQVSAIRNVPDFEGRMLSGRTTPAVEVAVHDLDMMLWLCGNATEVSAMASTIAPCGPGPDAVSAIVRFASGAVGTIATNWITPSQSGLPFVQRFSVFGTAGSATIDTSTSSLQVFGADGAAFPETSFLSENYGVFGGALAVEDAHFLACVAEKGTWPVSTADAVAALDLALAIDRSASTGTTVSL